MITWAIILSGCSGGAGMQATPPLSIAQTNGPVETASSPTTAEDTAAQESSDAAAASAPISKSKSVQEGEVPIPTGAGGRFLRA